MDRDVKIESTSILCVEGKDECKFFEALLKHQKITKVQPIDIGGKDKFLEVFTAFHNLEKFNIVERLGFVRDAEDNAATSAFTSICGVLSKCGLTPPTRQRIVTTLKRPHIGIFIMPDNIGPGMLENLCLETIKTQPVDTCINNFIDCFLKHQENGERVIYNGPKARVQAYLSTRSPIVNSLGLGAIKGYWNFEHTCFNEIKDFLVSLYQ